jgi:DNA processing protein
MNMDRRTEDIIALTLVEGLGPRSILSLIKAFEHTEDIFKASGQELKRVTGKNRVDVSKVSNARCSGEFSGEMRYIRKHGVRTVNIFEDAYPFFLKNIYDPPPVLFYKGDIKEACQRTVAVVGSRRCTYYGIKQAGNIAAYLATAGVTVVSGMARGIDSAAHTGCLRAGGPTIAVLGSGLGNIYPPEGRPLYEKIISSGAVVTEFPSGTKPNRYNFPRRNRIISGLSRCVVVVEASARSGAMITASLALEQGRDVMAVPGRIDQSSSKGPNLLIKEGAVPVLVPGDILQNAGIEEQRKTRDPRESISPLSKELSTEQEKVFKMISASDGLHIDNIIADTGFSIGRTNEILLRLQCAGIIEQLGGKRFIRK